MFISIKRVIYSGWKSFLRDREIALVTVFVLFLAITLSGTLLLSKDVGEFLVANIQESVDISVYFKEEVPKTEALDIKDEIAKFPEVKEVEYISQEEALESFTRRHEDESILIDSIQELGTNPFLASLNIRAWSPNQYAKVSDFLSGPKFNSVIEKVDYYQKETVIERVIALSSIASDIGIAISAVLVIIAVAVSFNTIRLSIYNSRKEIKVQRLVGASNLFIRGPFLVQGGICGISAALISLLLLGLVCWLISPEISNFFFDLDLFGLFIGNFWALFLTQLTVGISLGMFSSGIAIRKYLKA